MDELVKTEEYAEDIQRRVESAVDKFVGPKLHDKYRPEEAEENIADLASRVMTACTSGYPKQKVFADVIIAQKGETGLSKSVNTKCEAIHDAVIKYTKEADNFYVLVTVFIVPF